MDETTTTTLALDERVSEDRYGFYTVLFSNTQGYDIDEIMDVFAEYGEVVGVRRAGDDWGIHFVTFGTYEEAKSAVDGLADHPDIKLKVHYKSKSPYHHQRRRHFNGDERDDRWANDAPRWPRTNDRARAQYDERSEKKFVNNWADDYVGDSRWRASEECKDELTGEEAVVDRSSDDNRETSAEADMSSPWYNVESYLASMMNNEQQQQQQLAISETVAAAVNAEVVKAESVYSECSTSSEEEPVIERASEVIVGNVDPRTDEAYLLHLFSKYEPIAVSQLVPVKPSANVFYCSVYFKNNAVAEKVERMYDKMCLAGRQIVVQRPTRLIAAYLERI